MRTDLILELGVLRLPLALLVLVLATHHLELLLELSVLKKTKHTQVRHVTPATRSVGQTSKSRHCTS